MRRALLLALAALAACSQPAQQQAVPAASGTGEPAADSVVATAAAPADAKPVQPTAAPVVASPPSTARDPATVVVAWAKAMSLKDWGSAYLYWGEHGARSGLTRVQFAATWGKLANPEFELHPGTTEGGAGSLYYTAPIVLIDGQRQLRGEIVLRRVNDVAGATPEQLRWHIETLSIAP